MKYSDYFTKDNFKAIFAHDQVESEKIDHVWRQQYAKLKAENFDAPMLSFLVAKRDAEGLPKIKYSEGHTTRFSEVWNDFVDDKESEEDIIPDTFYKIISDATSNYKKEPVTEDFINIRYQKLVDMMTQGDFIPSSLSEDACQCYDCGQRFKMNIKSWAPTFNVFEEKADGKLDYRSFVEPESCIPNNIEEATINFPTGELIVADWIRIEEFTEAVDYQGKDKWSDSKSVNFGKGRVFLTNFYAQDHNFVHVSVGNSSPQVYQQGDNLIFGCNKKEEKYEEVSENNGFKEVANICTDLWGVTILDKQTLVEIIAKKSGDIATEIVEKYLKEDTNHEIVKVNPGDYNLKFHGNYYDFDKSIKDKELPDEIEKFFTVSSIPKPQKKNKM